MNNTTFKSNEDHLAIQETPRRRTKSFTSILGLKNTFSLKDNALESRESSLGSSKSFSSLRRGSKSQDRGGNNFNRSRGNGIDATGGIGDVPRSVSSQSGTSSTSSFSRKAPNSYSNSKNSNSSSSKQNHSNSPSVSTSDISTLSASGGTNLRPASSRREQPKGLVDSKFLFPSSSSSRNGSTSGLNTGNSGRPGDYNDFYDRNGRENGSTSGFIATLGLAPLLDESGQQVNLSNRGAPSSSYQFPSSLRPQPQVKSIRSPTPMSKEEQQRRTAEFLDAMLGPVADTNSSNKLDRRSKSPSTTRPRSISTPLLPPSHKNYTSHQDLPPLPQSVAKRLEQDSPPRPTPMILCETYTFPKPRIIPYHPNPSTPSNNTSSTKFVVGHQRQMSSIDKGKGRENLPNSAREGEVEELSLRGVLRENEESRLEREKWSREKTGRKLKKVHSGSRRGSESDSETSWGFKGRNTSVDQTATRVGRRRAGSEAGLLNQSSNQVAGAESPPVAKSFDPFSSLVNKVKSSTSNGRKSSIGSLFDNFSSSPNSRSVSRAQISPPTLLSKLGRQRSNSHLGITTSQFEPEKYRYIGSKPIIHTRQSPSVDTLFHRPSVIHASKTVVSPGQAISTSSAVPLQHSTKQSSTINNAFVVTPPHLHHLLKKPIQDTSYIPTRRAPDIPSIPSFSSRLNRLMLPLPTSITTEDPPLPRPLVGSPSSRAFDKEAALSMMLCDKLEKEEEESPSPPTRILPSQIARQAGFVPNNYSLSSPTTSRNKVLPLAHLISTNASNKSLPARPPTTTAANRSPLISPSALRLVGTRSSPPEYLNLSNSSSVLHKKPSFIQDPTLTPTLGQGTKIDYFPSLEREFGINSAGSNEEVKTPKTGGSYGSYNSEQSSVLRMDDASSFKDLFFKPPQPEFLRNSPQLPSTPYESSSNVASPLHEAFFGEIIPRPIRFVRPTTIISHFGEEGDSEVVIGDSDMKEEPAADDSNRMPEQDERNILGDSEISTDSTEVDFDRVEDDPTIVFIPALGEIEKEEVTAKFFHVNNLPIEDGFDSNRRSSFLDFSLDDQYLYSQSSNRNSQDSISDGNSFIDFSRDENSLPSFLDWSPTQSSMVARGHSFIHVDDSDEVSESENVDNTISSKSQYQSQPLLHDKSDSSHSNSNSFPQLPKSIIPDHLSSSHSDPSLLLPPSNEFEKPSPSTVNSSRFNSPRISSWSSTSQFSGLEQFPHPPISASYGGIERESSG